MKYEAFYDINNLILINPAIIPTYVDLPSLSGMPPRIFKEMFDENLFLTKINADITILIGTNDTIVPNKWGIEFAKAQEAKIQFFHDDHQFSNYINELPKIIKNII